MRIRRRLGRAEDVYVAGLWQQPCERVRVKHDYALFAASRLDAREREVFACCARGYTVAELSAEFHLSSGSICRIKASIRRKLADFLGMEPPRGPVEPEDGLPPGRPGLPPPRH